MRSEVAAVKSMRCATRAHWPMVHVLPIWCFFDGCSFQRDSRGMGRIMRERLPVSTVIAAVVLGLGDDVTAELEGISHEELLATLIELRQGLDEALLLVPRYLTKTTVRVLRQLQDSVRRKIAGL